MKPISSVQACIKKPWIRMTSDCLARSRTAWIIRRDICSQGTDVRLQSTNARTFHHWLLHCRANTPFLLPRSAMPCAPKGPKPSYVNTGKQPAKETRQLHRKAPICLRFGIKASRVCVFIIYDILVCFMRYLKTISYMQDIIFYILYYYKMSCKIFYQDILLR